MVYIRPHYFHPKTRNLKRVVFHTDRQVFRLWKIYVAYIRLHYFHPKIRNLKRVVFPKHMFYGGPFVQEGVTALRPSNHLFVALQNSTSFFFSAPTLQYTSLHHKAPTIFFCLALQRSKQFQINKGSSASTYFS